MVFDLLVLDGEPVHERPLARAPRLLEELLDPTVDAVRLSPAFEDGEALLTRRPRRALEGVVAKRADAPYRPGQRTPEWQKVKLRAQEDLPIVGYTRGTGRRAKLGALVLGRREADGLHWAGNVGSGLARRRGRPAARAARGARTADLAARRDAAHAARARRRT